MAAGYDWRTASLRGIEAGDHQGAISQDSELGGKYYEDEGQGGGR